MSITLSRYLVCLAIIATVPIMNTAHAAVDDAVPVEYVRTLDGNTIVVILDGEETNIRLFGIDVDKLHAGTASAFFHAFGLAGLLETADSLKIETDTTTPTDNLGITMAWVWMKVPNYDYSLLNELIIQQGVAGYDTGCPSKIYAAEMVRAATTATLIDFTALFTPSKSKQNKPTPPPTAGGSHINITDSGMRWTKDSGDYTYYSWRADIRNDTLQTVKINIHLSLLDKDGFELGDANMFQQVLRPGENSFSDASLIKGHLWGQVENYKVSAEIVNY